MRKLSVLGLGALAMLAGCGGGDETGLTAEEDRQLNEAAEMLDASPDSLVASDDAELGNGEAPAAETGDLPVTDEPPANAAANSQ